MSPPLLATKLYLPPPRPQVVRRPRLIERLNAGVHRKLTLISAPAGFGKTTLVSAWVAGCERPTAWLSLDADDSEPARFLRYLVTALQTVAPTVGHGVLRVLQDAQPPTEALLTALLNEITTLPDPCLLVLDDYHLIDGAAVDQALTFLLEHLPPQLHLMIATREDPPLPLPRLRARGQLTELRAADLRFTPAEAATFLTEVMGLDLAADDIAALEARTEGWIAGLQLAALSMQGRADVAGFIQAFTGDHRYIMDYLVEEVLRCQPERVRDFLLQTCILDRLSGPLCDAVTSEEGGAALLEALHRGNLFVVPLDDRRQWYRYHHLFAEVLAAQLQAEQPERVVMLHQRASVWYAQQGAAAEAIRHALAARDVERAADLVELAVPAMRRSRQVATLLGWFKALPDAVIRRRPVLSAVYGSVLLASGELAGVEERLRDAERWLDPTVDSDEGAHRKETMVVVDEEAFRRLPATLAVWRAGQAMVLGDVAGTVTYARRALDLIPEDDHLERGGAVAFLGLAAWTSGDLATAHRVFVAGLARVQEAGFLADAINGALAVADIQIAQGRLHEAMRTYERAWQLATEQRPADTAERAPDTQPLVGGMADLLVGMSALHVEWDDLRAAREQLLRSNELAEGTGLPYNRSHWCAAMARICQVDGDLDGALKLLDEAERLHVRSFFPVVRPVAALKARVWIAQGRLGAARDWARSQGLSADDDLSYVREFEHITLARVLLARSTSDRSDRSVGAVMRLLQRLLQAAEQGERTGSVIEILIVQALAYRATGDIPAALVALQRALTLAEPEGYVRIFVDEGPPMAHLLLEAAARGVMPDYIDTLLAACGVEQLRRAGDAPLPTVRRSSPLVEPLSERELDVLRLFKTELSGPEIARELMIGLSTVRSHTKSIYSKLDVSNRRAAVIRAEELGLI